MTIRTEVSEDGIALPDEAPDTEPETPKRRPGRPRREPMAFPTTPLPKTSGRKTANEKDAEQAAKVLGQINDLLVLGLMGVSAIPGVPFSFMNTASGIAAGNEAFMAQAQEALVTDPNLCKSILRVGKAGGKAALATAYLSLAITAAPGVMEDIRAAQEANADADSENTPGSDGG